MKSWPLVNCFCRFSLFFDSKFVWSASGLLGAVGLFLGRPRGAGQSLQVTIRFHTSQVKAPVAQDETQDAGRCGEPISIPPVLG